MATAALIGCTFLSAAASVSADAPPSQAYFTSAGTMTFARFGPAVAPLANGDVLIAGGEGGNGPVSTAELYDPAAGTFTPTAGDLPTSLFGAAAAPLPDGEVLIVGGFSTSGFLASMELYDPTTQTFSSTTSLPQAQGLPTAVPLPGGDVLIAGGETSGGDPAAAEIYDPSAGTFTPTANAVPGGPIRTTGAQLPDGDVLIAGGLSSLNQALTSAAIYDPASRTFTALTSPLAFATADASAAPLPDGDVLIAGGYDGGTLSGAQLYDPITQTFTVTASLPAATDTAGAAGLPNGEVLLTGGENGSAEPVSRAELYVPAAEASLTGGALGDVATGSTSGEAKVVVENVGAQTLQISGLTASGPNAADFTVLSDACEGTSLAFGQSCALEVTFTPSEPAAESAELTLADNEATPGAVALSGTGVAPITGAAGNTGPAGNAGPAGATGAAGPAGPTGPVGAAGATGAIGPAGATGSAGATGAAGASGAPGSVSIAACPAATGSASGSRIGRVRLGESRTSAERAYPETSNRGYPDKDFFCLANGDTRVWYPSAAELSSLPRGLRSAVSGRVVWISTANPRYSLDGVRAGDRLNVAKARLRLGAPIKDGLNDWYLVSVSGRTVTLKVQAGEVEEVGVADHELTATHAQQVRLVRSY